MASVSPQHVASRSFASITLLRGVASLLVVWDHLVAIWNDTHGSTFLPLTTVRTYITTPLGIIQDFGFLGVALFFLISGFIITYVAQREDWLTFITKRLFRIYPPFIISIIVILILNNAYTAFTGIPTNTTDYSPQALLKVMTLLNYFLVPQYVINGVAWTLAIEMLFYVLCGFVLPLLKRRPIVASLVLLLFCVLVVNNSRNYGDNFFLFAATTAYLPILLIGQVIYYAWDRRIRPLQAAALILAHYLAFIYGTMSIHTTFYNPENSYAISCIYAFGIFSAALLLEAYLRAPRPLEFYSKISYSLYLYHGAVGLLALDLLAPRIGYPIALVVVFIGVTYISYLSWRFVEEPSQRLARSVLRRIREGFRLSRPNTTAAN